MEGQCRDLEVHKHGTQDSKNVLFIKMFLFQGAKVS